jgi:hypothetical protein
VICIGILALFEHRNFDSGANPSLNEAFSGIGRRPNCGAKLGPIGLCFET